jgi:hypothetical protein
MPRLIEQLDITRCPHCKIDKPNIGQVHATKTNNFSSNDERFWRVYSCRRCGGLITASSSHERGEVTETYPQSITLDEAIPERAREFLDQAINSLHAPSGAVMLSASSVDAMLKKKGYGSGTLNSRIDKATKDGLITKAMAEWAHAVRLDANDQRHADEGADLPSEADAQKSIDFVMALGQFLFVLPMMVEKGLNDAKGD